MSLLTHGPIQAREVWEKSKVHVDTATCEDAHSDQLNTFQILTNYHESLH